MRLLHVVPTYLPAWRYGGTITSVHALCRALAARGHEVRVVTTNVDGDGETDVPIGRPVTIDGVQVHYYPSPALRRIYWSPDLRRALMDMTGGFDLLHLHSVFLYPTNIAARIASAVRVPYVLSPRGMLVPSLIRKKSSLAKRAWLALFERRTISRAAAVHFTSELESEDAAELRLPLPETFVIPNGVDVAPPATPPPAASRSILFLGRLDAKKGLDLLLEATALTRETRLVIVGPDDAGMSAGLLARAADLSISDRVEILDPVVGERKWEVLRSVGLLALASESENFGNVIVEALAAGTPVITVPSVGASSIVTEAGAGLVVDRNPSELARGIESILGDEEQRRAMGERGRKHVVDHFGWDSIAARMERRYAAIISASRP